MGWNWVEDLGDAAKNVGNGIVKAADVATDTIVDKDAWGRTFQAMADGPGGKTVHGSDLVNMLLDSTMLIPGVGLAGGAARVGARVAGRMAEKEVAELAARKLAEKSLDKTLLRSPVNNTIRGGVDDLFKRTGRDAMIRDGLKTGGEKGARKAAGKAAKWDVKDAALRAAKPKGALRNQVDRMAAKQEAGIGTKVGFGQTRKRIGANLAMSGGANLLTRAYDEGLLDLNGPDGPRDQKVEPRPMLQSKAGGVGGYGAPGTLYIVGAGGEQQAVPQSFMDALAAFMKQNGGVGGHQVIYND